MRSYEKLVGEQPCLIAPYTDHFVTSPISGRGNRIGPVCVSVCQLVSTVMAEPFEVRTPNLVQVLTLMISKSNLMVKVIGQRSRSPGHKTWFLAVQLGYFGTIIGLCVSIHHEKRTLWQRNFNNAGRRRCVNAQALPFALRRLSLIITTTKIGEGFIESRPPVVKGHRFQTPSDSIHFSERPLIVLVFTHHKYYISETD